MEDKLQDAVDRGLLNDLRRYPPGDSVPGSSISTTETSCDTQSLLESLVTRLNNVEKEWRAARETIKRKDNALMLLTRDFEEFREEHKNCRSLDSDDPVHQEEMEYLKGTNSRLKRQLKDAWSQVADMKQFLNDYGMVWVGEEGGGPGGQWREGPDVMHVATDAADPPSSQVSSHPREATSASLSAGGVAGRAETGKAPKHHGDKGALAVSGMGVDMALLRSRVDELNALAGDGKSQVVTGANGETKLKAVESISLVVWEDGFQLRGGPHRPSSLPQNKAFLQDLLDGYFPYELKDQYPDGVPFQIMDRSTVAFTASAAASFQPFTGAGVSLRAGAQQAKGFANVHSIKSFEDNPAPPLSAEKFSQQLPAAVIRNGKVFNVRDEIKEYLQGGSGAAVSEVLLETPVMSSVMQPGRKIIRPTSSDGGRELTTLRVKDEEGSSTYVLKLHTEETIGQLRLYINKHRGHAHPYEIRSSFPVRTYTDTSETMLAAGLVPNAALFLKTIK